MSTSLKQYAVNRENALARTIAAATATPSPKRQTKAQNESAKRAEQLGSRMRRGHVNPASLYELQQKASAEAVAPSEKLIAECGGGIGGWLRALRMLNQ